MSESESIDIHAAVEAHMTAADDPYEALNAFARAVSAVSPLRDNPVGQVFWVPLERVRANDYNPNQVADKEMELLYRSIKADGYTQPVVVVEDESKEPTEYEIVDGFHRYLVMKRHDDISERSDGHLPVTVIDKPMNERRASTIRHNRARGKHSVKGKSEVVFDMLDDGWSDERICAELGMEPEELARLKHVTGFSKLFDDVEYQQAWKATRQLQVEEEFKDVEGRP